MASAASSAVKAAPRSCPSMPIENPASVSAAASSCPWRIADRSGAVSFPQAGAEEEAMLAHRRVAVRQSVAGVEFDRAFEQYERPHDLLRHAGIDIGLSAQHEIVGIETVRPFSLDTFDFRFPHARRDRTHR